MGAVSPDVPGFLDQMWLTYRHLAVERVEAIEAYLVAAMAGGATEELRSAAESAAHKLVGALGSFRRPGSDESAQAEELLRRGAVADLAPVVAQLRRLVVEDQPPPA